MEIIKNIVRFMLPSIKIRRFFKRHISLNSIYESYLIFSIEKKHQVALKRIKGKKIIKVAFFLIHESVWKYESVYHLMEKDERFDPIVVVCPYMSYGEENMLNEMNNAYNSFKKKGYNIIKSLNEKTGKWLDVKKDINPDIVFFTNPHKLTKKEYYILNFIDTLTCYVQYSFHVSYLNQSQYDKIFHNLLWRAFYETPIHYEMAKNTARNNGRNIIITGYPGVDNFFVKNYIPEDPWVIKDRKVKRIIWAPHHTIEGSGANLDYSNFLRYADFMLNLADKFVKKIQIAFKPHPLLYMKLCNDNVWGKEKTKNYYNVWNMKDNCQLNISNYSDLFLTSDALIHDSGSFLAEYLCVDKPVLFTMRDDTTASRFNQFGKMCLLQHYHAYNSKDIMKFIEKRVINHSDSQKHQRSEFKSRFLLPSNGKMASENIFNQILIDIRH